MTYLPKNLSAFLWFFISKHKYKFLLFQIFCFGFAIDQTIWPYAFGRMIEALNNYKGQKQDIWVYLTPVLFFWAGLWITLEIMFRLQGIMRALIWPKFSADIRMALFDYVSGHSYNYFANNFAGNLSNKISDMVSGVIAILQLLMSLFIPAFVALIIVVIMFFFINPVFAALITVWVFIHISVCLITAKKCSYLSEIHSDAKSDLSGKIVDAFTNIVNVHIFAKRKYEYNFININQEVEQKLHFKSLIYIEKVKIILGILSIIFPGILITWYQIYSWQHDYITLGQLVITFNATWNITMLAWFCGLELPNLFREIGTCRQALRLVQKDHDIVDIASAQDLKVSRGSIEFKEVSFNYARNNNIFANKSLFIEGGSKVGLVGFSGSGKTTFVNLIMRFFDIDSGKILIDGQDISQVKLNSLRSSIAMIPQDPTLFHRTLIENIRYGNEHATQEEIEAATKLTSCDEFINKLPDKYLSLVGERGIKLSGGQRQRIAIARAILKNAPILILDEATSALDSVTEKYIQNNLKAIMGTRTTIIIAHRLSTLAMMDRILVFDKGHVIEDGSHEELIQKNGHYAKMWQMQAGGFLPEKE